MCPTISSRAGSLKTARCWGRWNTFRPNNVWTQTRPIFEPTFIVWVARFITCLLGIRPFTGSTGELILAHAQKIPPTANLVNPTVPVELGDVVAKMLAKQPERRFQTPGEIVETLRPFASNRSSRTSGSTPAPTLAPETHGPEMEVFRDTSVDLSRSQVMSDALGDY